MGTDCHVLVVGPGGDGHCTAAEEQVYRLERLWSRFDPDSEVSRMNAAAGETVTVTTETFALVEKAVLAWQMTDGRFDPTMAHRIVDLGYDRSFETINSLDMADTVRAASGAVEDRSAGCGDILLSRYDCTVRLPPGLGFDPGGIGKGLAADIVSKAAIDNGAWGVLVNLGGDLRVRGTPPSGDAWMVTITEPTVANHPLATIALTDGGLATSTTRKRRWRMACVENHHLLDPVTGLPADTDVDLVSAVAGDAWWAEAAATALIVPGESGSLTPPGCAAIRVHRDGTTERLADFEGYET
jgi:thiamine biosynthesis lipoprotein